MKLFCTGIEFHGCDPGAYLFYLDDFTVGKPTWLFWACRYSPPLRIFHTLALSVTRLVFALSLPMCPTGALLIPHSSLPSSISLIVDALLALHSRRGLSSPSPHHPTRSASLSHSLLAPSIFSPFNAPTRSSLSARSCILLSLLPHSHYRSGVSLGRDLLYVSASLVCIPHVIFQ